MCNDKVIPKVFCPECNKFNIGKITELCYPKDDTQFSGQELCVLSCVECDTVLNLDKVPEIEWISIKEAEELGWYKMNQDELSDDVKKELEENGCSDKII